MGKNIPEKLINFRVYLDGIDLLGVADAQLPAIESIMETVQGAGIAGEIETPTLGHFGPMPLSLNWRTVTSDAVKLAQQKAHHLDLRGAIQSFDPKAGVYVATPLKVVVRARPKKIDPGKLVMGKAQESSSEFECHYFKMWLDGNEMIEIDKLNFICLIDGEDQLASTREALGLN